MNTVTVFIDGEPIALPAGASLGAGLLAIGRRGLRRGVGSGDPRGLFCAMGVCHECVVQVDGRPVRACLTPVHEAMRVELEDFDA